MKNKHILSNGEIDQFASGASMLSEKLNIIITFEVSEASQAM